MSSILLASLLAAREAALQNSVGEKKKEEEEEEDLSLAYAARGQANTLRYCFIIYTLDSEWWSSSECDIVWSFSLNAPPSMIPGFARYPMVGYIYKVNSTSSEEIWL